MNKKRIVSKKRDSYTGFHTFSWEIPTYPSMSLVQNQLVKLDQNVSVVT